MAKTNGTNGAVAVSGGFDVAKFMKGAVNAKKAAAGGRAAFLRMDKDRQGQWCFGAEDNDIDARQELYVDPEGHVYGWQCWADTKDGKVPAANLGTIMVPTHEDLPPMPHEIPEGGRPWQEMRGMSLLLDGTPLTYTTTSMGGTDAVAAFMGEFVKQLQTDPSKPIAVITLASDSYKNKRFGGRTYVPIFVVKRWVASLPKAAVTPPTKAVGKQGPKAPLKRPAAPTTRAARR